MGLVITPPQSKITAHGAGTDSATFPMVGDPDTDRAALERCLPSGTLALLAGEPGVGK